MGDGIVRGVLLPERGLCLYRATAIPSPPTVPTAAHAALALAAADVRQFGWSCSAAIPVQHWGRLLSIH